MKRLFLLLTLTCLCQVSVAQTDFCVPGATWVYYHQGDGGPWFPELENFITYAGDTVIGDLTAQRLHTIRRADNSFTGQTSNVSYDDYVRKSSDSVFVYVDNAWEFVFDLGAEVGDTQVVYLGEVFTEFCVARDTLVVSAVIDSSLWGTNIRFFEYRLLIEDWVDFYQETLLGWRGYYLERIGFLTEFPTTQPLRCESFIADYLSPEFYCYSDDEVTISPSSGCGQILSLQEQNTSSIEILQAGERLIVQNAPNSTLRIFDILGKELFHASVNSDYQSFDINHLPNGILMVVLESEKSRIAKKLVKTSN